LQPHDTHIPEAAWMAVPAQYVESSKRSWTKIRNTGNVPRRPLRLFTRPQPVDFVMMPYLHWRKAQRIVTQCEGPERIAMEWWRHQTPQPTRDYFRVQDGEGRRYWLYRNGVFERDGIMPQWFLHGTFA
jgi:protein ImuB